MPNSSLRDFSIWWHRIFFLEIFICLATAIFWVASPSTTIENLYPPLVSDIQTNLLLYQTANVLFCCYVYLYARLLFAKQYSLSSFRYLQEAALIGDVFIITMAIVAGVQIPNIKLGYVAAQIVMAGFWGGVRLSFLIATRETADCSDFKVFCSYDTTS